MNTLHAGLRRIVAGALAAMLAASAVGAAAPARHGSGGKPAAPVDIRFSLPGKVTAGVPLTVTLDILCGIDADELILQWQPSAGLELGATPNPAVIATPVKGRHFQQRVTLTAAADGEYFLGTIASLRSGSATQTRAVSLRINVGTVAAQAKPALSTDSTRRLIEAMPAQETRPR